MPGAARIVLIPFANLASGRTLEHSLEAGLIAVER